METRDTAQALTALELAHIIHDGSSRNPGVAQRDGRVELRRTEAYWNSTLRD